jgi:hypothetical protein
MVLLLERYSRDTKLTPRGYRYIYMENTRSKLPPIDSGYNRGTKLLLPISGTIEVPSCASFQVQRSGKLLLPDSRFIHQEHQAAPARVPGRKVALSCSYRSTKVTPPDFRYIQQRARLLLPDSRYNM